MDDTSSPDVFEKLKQFQVMLESNRLSSEEMLHEIRMMNFKLRPLSGEIAELDFSNEGFLHALWKLGKLDELFRREFGSLHEDDRELFFRLVDEMRLKLQYELNRATVWHKDMPDKKRPQYEVEIIKDLVRHTN